MKLLKKNKILIVGCGYEQLDAIYMAKKKGFYVIGADKNINAPGNKICDEFFSIDIKKKKLILSLAKKKKINGIFTIASDLAVPTVNFVQKKLKINPNKNFDAKFTTNKFFMKKKFIENNIPTSNFIKLSTKKKLQQFLTKNKLPLVLKPIFSYGQKGIFLINNKNELNKKILLAKKNCQHKSALIEEYKEGYEINIILIVENYKIKNFFISKRLTQPNKTFGIADQHIYPAQVPLNLKKKIIKDLNNLILSLNFKSGILYPQIMIKDNNYFFIEIASRVPGGFMREMMLLANGLDPIEFEILNSLSTRNIFKNLKLSKKYKSVNVLFLTKKNYKHKRIKKIDKQTILKKNSDLYDIIFNYNVNDTIPILKNSTHRVGAIITKSTSLEKSYKASMKILNTLNR
mgnify:CR=1 FL=1